MTRVFTRSGDIPTPYRATLPARLLHFSAVVVFLWLCAGTLAVGAASGRQDSSDSEALFSATPRASATPITDSSRKLVSPSLESSSWSSSRFQQDSQRTPLPESFGGFKWKEAVLQSFEFATIIHAYRIAFQPDSRPELGGPTFLDYIRSVATLHGWSDNDPFEIQYVGHSLEGEVAAHIQINNDPRGRLLYWGAKGYWKSRLKALASAAIFGVQFKIGPLSEAMIGNVGLPNQYRKQPLPPGTEHGLMTWSEFFIDPIGGFSLLIVEDLMEHYMVSKFESKNHHLIRLARTFFCPVRSASNILRWRFSWYRDGRPLGVPDTGPFTLPDNYGRGGYADR